MTYEHGGWKANCSRCGGTYMARQLRLEWNGLRVCSGPGTRGCFEPRHPQDHVKGKADRQNVPWTQPEPADQFIGTDVPAITQDDL